jgi:CHAT domain
MNTSTVILLLGASPQDRVALGLDTEFDRIDRAVRVGSLRDRFAVRVSQETRGDQLVPLLLETNATVVQFSGHGTGEGLVFETADAQSQPLSTDFLGRVFADLASVRCVLLNACYSAAQANAIATHVGAVIAMNDRVSDVAASAFSEIFYQALAEGHSLRSAFDLGVIQVEIAAPGESETPIWIGSVASGNEVLAAQAQHRGVIARQLYETDYLALARSISALLDDQSCGSVVEEVFGEFVVTEPPVDAGRELLWIRSRVLAVAGERISGQGGNGGAVGTGEAGVDRVLAAIRAQPPLQAQMLLHRYYHHHTDQEIAAALTVDVNTVAAVIEGAMQQVALFVKVMK